MLVLSLVACLPELDPGSYITGDASPPVLLSWDAINQDEFLLVFDEAVRARTEDFILEQGGQRLPVKDVSHGENDARLIVKLNENCRAGEKIMVNGLVRDETGNGTSFSLPFWGFNPNPARLIINEVISQGSASKPDLVEFRVVDGGNLAALTFYVGTAANYEHRYIFPELEVEKDDYIVLHMKPLGLEAELDELESKDQSGGTDANPDAWDFWYREPGGGIPGFNGALCISGSPMGEIQDAFLYSERNSFSDERYRGFGTAGFLDRAEYIAGHSAWKFEDDEIRPEDCFYSKGTTATRSMCRHSSGIDSDSAEDWHIVPTRGATPGSSNSDDVYTP